MQENGKIFENLAVKCHKNKNIFEDLDVKCKKKKYLKTLVTTKWRQKHVKSLKKNANNKHGHSPETSVE